MAEKSSELKAELARKKKKLEELRRNREMRVPSGDVPLPPQNLNVDNLVESLLRGSGNVPAAVEAVSPEADHGSPLKATPHRVLTARMSRRTRAMLSISEIKSVNIPPAEVINYTKSVQTDPLPELDKTAGAAKGVDPEDEERDARMKDAERKRQEEEVRRREEERALRAKAMQEEEKPPILPPEKAAEVMSSVDFQSFFDRSTRIIERALSQRYDIARDYGAREEGDEEGLTSDNVQLLIDFPNTIIAGNRAVTAIDWSEKDPELLAVAYTANEEAPNDPDGMVVVWNIGLEKRPEYPFECQSAVMSCRISPYQPSIVVGGTYSGQIVLWDMRERKRTPIQRSGLTARSHTHPVYSLDIVGSQHSYSLVTVSTDGRMCTWDLERLAEPTESVDLTFSQKPVAATCLSFPQGDFNTFAMGSEEGTIFGANRHSMKVTESFEGHTGPVTAIDFHKGRSGEHARYFLSSSTDWTVKLWSLQSKTCIYSFEDASDYVYDVQWSTLHPSLFVSADGNGELDFWNPNSDTEAPVLSVSVNNNKQSVNRIRWSRPGLHLAAGDAVGNVFVYKVGEKLAVPRADESARFKDTISEMAQISADAAS